MDFFQCLGSRGVSSVFLTTRDRGSLCSGWEARGETREEVLEVLPGEMVDTSSESEEGIMLIKIFTYAIALIRVRIDSLGDCDMCSGQWTLIWKYVTSTQLPGMRDGNTVAVCDMVYQCVTL